MSSRRLFTAYWVWMGFLLVAYYTIPPLGLYLWSAIGVSSASAVVVGTMVHRPRRRLPWLLIALALFVFTAGDTSYLILTDVLGESNPFPSIADVLYLAMYPLLVAGLLMLRRSAAGRDQAGFVDTLVLTAGLGLLSWIFLISPHLEDETQSSLQRLTSIAYPISDVIFLAVAARILTSVRFSPCVGLMAFGGISLLATDVTYGLAQLSSNWEMGGVVDFGWIVFYATWGAAALHPSMTALTEPAVVHETDVSGLRLGVLTGSALIPPAVLLVEASHGTDIDAVPIAILSGVVFLLVLLRLAGVVRKYRQATERERSLREAGATLVSATDVDTVRAVVTAAVGRLFPPNASYEMALPLKEETLRDDTIPREVRESFAREPGPTRYVRSNTITAASLQHLRAYELTLLSPLMVTTRLAGDQLIGTLVVAAHEQRLKPLQSAIEVLAGQAALAIDRITLNSEVARRDSEQYFRTLVQNTTDVILIVNDDSTIRYASPSAATMFANAPLAGRAITDLVVASQRDLAKRTLIRLQGGEDPPGLAHWTTSRPDGTAVEVEVSFRDLRTEPTVRGIVFTVRDVTEKRRLDRQLNHLAFHDSLTGLPNRVRFSEQVRQAVDSARPDPGVVGVLFVDVDDFKLVNDTMGHETGDRLLQVIGKRLSAVVGHRDTAARLGGDEFAVLIENAGSTADVERVADRIVEALAEPVVLGGSLLSASASIGVATTVDASADSELLRKADLALYVAKGAGKGRWRRYESGLHTSMVKKMEVRSALDRAITRHDFALAYQPIVRLANEAPVGLEALLRWVDPERGVVLPGEFIDVAEESGLIVPIGNWALERALADAAEWASASPDHPPYLSLNISVRQFHSPGLIPTIRRELNNSGLPPDRLLLEITESLLLRDDERVWGDLTRLRDLGIRVAIDDFGTGYSSLSYLRQVAIDVLKIDRSFIQAMGSSTQQRALVETIVRLADTLGLDVVAEGIERAADRDRLIAMGCPFGQGFLFARPLSQDDTLQWLPAHHVTQPA